MKYKVLIICSFFVTVGLLFGYFTGYNIGVSAGNATGYDKGSFVGYENGYVSGYDNGKEFVETHLEQYVTTPKVVKYDEVVEFLKEDVTDKIAYSNLTFDCTSYARVIKENATTQGIKCALVVLDMSEVRGNTSHAINCFETTDRGIVYFDPQTDGQRYDVRVGGTYILQGISYKITKVDVIW